MTQLDGAAAGEIVPAAGQPEQGVPGEEAVLAPEGEAAGSVFTGKELQLIIALRGPDFQLTGGGQGTVWFLFFLSVCCIAMESFDRSI